MPFWIQQILMIAYILGSIVYVLVRIRIYKKTPKEKVTMSFYHYMEKTFIEAPLWFLSSLSHYNQYLRDKEKTTNSN